MKNFIQKILALANLELRKKDGRSSQEGILRHLRALGFAPAVVIDAGAAFGDWTRQVAPLFPHASYHLFEPLAEYTATLTTLNREFPHTFIHVNHTLLGSTPGPKKIHVHKDLVGSSVYSEEESSDSLVSSEREVACTTLDDAIPDAPGPLLLKVDVQGAELEILHGATRVLEVAEVVQLETSLFNALQGAPLLDEVIAYMDSKGFVPYDITNFTYRPLDNALAQVDIFFVRKNGVFRQEHAFATEVQRKAQNERFIQKAQSRLS